MTPPTVSKTSAPGVWTVDQALQNQQAGVWPFGGPFNYIEDVFSTYLWTGNGANRTITNDIDLSTNGGLVWIKKRSAGAPNSDNVIYDTERGANNQLATNTNGGSAASTLRVTSFNNNGFNLGTSTMVNESNQTYVGWTFRKQARFFDIVTYTGNGANRTIAHNLGSVPGCILIKKLNTTGSWAVYHRSTGNGQFGLLNATNAFTTTGASAYWNSTSPTSTEFSVGTNANVNENGSTFIAYLFAHDAGGFGLLGTDNVISCGSYVGNGTATGPTVTLGFEPQWIFLKNVSNTSSPSTYGNWYVYDTMRGITTGGADASLYPNATVAESSLYGGNQLDLTSTGFVAKDSSATNVSGETYIYVAIRRGPMRTPTSGASVFNPTAITGAAGSAITTGFPIDLELARYKSFSNSTWVVDRLRGFPVTVSGDSSTLSTNTTNASFSNGGYPNSCDWDNTKALIGNNLATSAGIWWHFRRAPGFMDVVCYSGSGAGTNNQSHNLGVTPEMLIFKSRNTADNWAVFLPALNIYTVLNSTSGKLNGSPLPSAVTATTFDVGGTTGYSSVASVNISGYTYVAYLFASCPGVSKVGSFTQVAGVDTAVNCGFTSGARFILIKSTATTSNDDWYVWDSARGITSGTEPYLRLNISNAEVTTANSIVPNASGFTTSGSWWSAGTYIYLAIA